MSIHALNKFFEQNLWFSWSGWIRIRLRRGHFFIISMKKSTLSILTWEEWRMIRNICCLFGFLSDSVWADWWSQQMGACCNCNSKMFRKCTRAPRYSTRKPKIAVKNGKAFDRTTRWPCQNIRGISLFNDNKLGGLAFVYFVLTFRYRVLQTLVIILKFTEK